MFWVNNFEGFGSDLHDGNEMHMHLIYNVFSRVPFVWMFLLPFKWNVGLVCTDKGISVSVSEQFKI